MQCMFDMVVTLSPPLPLPPHRKLPLLCLDQLPKSSRSWTRTNGAQLHDDDDELEVEEEGVGGKGKRTMYASSIPGVGPW